MLHVSAPARFLLEAVRTASSAETLTRDFTNHKLEPFVMLNARILFFLSLSLDTCPS